MDRVSVLEDVYRRWGEGDFRAGFELYDPGMTLEIHNPIPDAGVYEGIEGLQRYMRGFLDTWEEYEIRAEAVEVDGDRVVVRVHHGGRASGAWAEMNYFQIWTFDGDRVVRMDIGTPDVTPPASP
jgi:ketosteroid isomerase-like protein